jgi:hypothetical protein
MDHAVVWDEIAAVGRFLSGALAPAR